MYERMMQKKALELTCYVVGAGAFSVFIRWLQTMMAFNEDGLADRSFWNVAVVLIVIAAMFVFRHFLNKFEKQRFYLPEDFYLALRNEGKIYKYVRWGIGLLMVAGALVLVIGSETDKNATALKIVALFGAASGFAFIFMMTAANKPMAPRVNMTCFCATVPVVFCAVWLIVTYKINSINSEEWSYGLMIVTLIVAMCAFSRIAGFAFSSAKPKRAMFVTMMGADMLFMSIADSKYMGLQLMLGAGGAMLAYCNWVMVCNMRQKEAPEKTHPDDGFDRL